MRGQGGGLESVPQDAISECVLFEFLTLDVPWMGMVGKLLNDLKRCVKKVYSPMISLLFVFCHLVTIQVLCIKALLCVNNHSLQDFCKTRTLHLHG